MKSLILLGMVAFIATGCGSQSNSKSTVNNSTPLPSTGGGGTTTATPTLVDYGGTYSPQPGNIHFKVKTIINGFGQVDPSNVRVRFLVSPTGLDSSSNDVNIDFYVKGISSNGTEVYPSNPWRPAKVRFETISTLQPACPSTGANGCYFGWDPAANNGQGGNYPINKSALTSISLANPGQQPTLTSYNIIVTGADQIYQILRVQVTSPSGVQIAEVLIPRYEANPNVYRDTRNALLHPFHPLWSEVNNGLDSNGYKQRILSLFYF